MDTSISLLWVSNIALKTVENSESLKINGSSHSFAGSEIYSDPCVPQLSSLFAFFGAFSRSSAFCGSCVIWLSFDLNEWSIETSHGQLGVHFAWCGNTGVEYFSGSVIPVGELQCYLGYLCPRAPQSIFSLVTDGLSCSLLS